MPWGGRGIGRGPSPRRASCLLGGMKEKVKQSIRKMKRRVNGGGRLGGEERAEAGTRGFWVSESLRRETGEEAREDPGKENHA